MKKLSRDLCVLLLLAASMALAEDDASEVIDAMDELLLERTEIAGNRELPKVLYIVPWHKSDPGALVGKPVNTLLDEVLAPLDRSEFIRRVDYYSDLYDVAPAAIPARAEGSFPNEQERHPANKSGSRESGNPGNQKE